MNIRVHLVFDLDGTLVDTAKVVGELIAQMRADRGLAPLEREKLISYMSIGGLEMMKGVLDVEENEAETALGCFRNKYIETQTPFDHVYPGVPETLTALADSGAILSICTNKPRALALKVLSETGLLHYFRRISAGDDLPTRKPNRLNLEACLDPGEYNSMQILMVGDSTVDEALSRDAGVPFWFFSGGYDDGVTANRADKSFSCYKQFPLRDPFVN